MKSRLALAAALLMSACAGADHPPVATATAPVAAPAPGGRDTVAEETPVNLSAAALQAADAALRAGDPRQAANVYLRAYQRTPSGDLAARYARALRLAGDAQAAVLFLQEAQARHSGDVALTTELGRAALAGGYLPEAADALAKAAAMPGAGHETFMAYGACAARKGDYALAETQFRRALTTAPSTRESMSAMANLALLKAERGDLPGAIADLEALVQRPGVHPRARADLALLYGLSGDMAKFREHAGKSLRSPGDIDRAARWLDGSS